MRVDMCVCACMRICTRVQADACARMHRHVRACVSMCTGVHMYERQLHAHAFICVQAACTLERVCAYTCMGMCMCVHMYVCICMGLQIQLAPTDNI